MTCSVVVAKMGFRRTRAGEGALSQAVAVTQVRADGGSFQHLLSRDGDKW